MKILRYPKTYAKLVEVKRVNESTLIGHTYYVNIYVYEAVETGEIIEARNPGRSGHTPNNAERETVVVFEKVGRKRKQKRTVSRVKMVGKIFKLYQRPQDAGRWMYRWLGQ